MKCLAGVEFPNGAKCPRCGAGLGEVCWPGINAELAEIPKLRAVYTAARALCMTHDWNAGALGVPARKGLLEAVNAVEPLPDLKGKMKANVA